MLYSGQVLDQLNQDHGHEEAHQEYHCRVQDYLQGLGDRLPYYILTLVWRILLWWAMLTPPLP